ncbi:hypothetical protein [Novosphingobium terrae]|jgi:hypothetical protein|uniref:hypothetical protein n=1 Tax=Novosphingobium terrae TaxID=2726189 RepID=UPI00197FAFD1|nr:hypothetical protein [Novosphingobium terrae]
MIVLAALLALQGFTADAGEAPKSAAQTMAQAANTEAGSDLSALEKKLEVWKGRWGYNDGKFGCETRNSSGDSAVDSVGCQALMACLGPEEQRLNAIAQGAGDDKTRGSEMQAIVAKAQPCIAEKRHQGLIALAQLRNFGGAGK